MRLILVATRIEGLAALLGPVVEKVAGVVGEELRLVTLAEYHASQQIDSNQPEIVVGDPGLLATELDALPNLQWYQSTWAGVNPVFTHTRRRDFRCSRAGGIFGEAMSEYILTHILWLERRMAEATNGTWVDHERFRQCRPLSTLRVGIIGFGVIGRHVAGVLTKLGVKVLGVTRQSAQGCVEVTQDIKAVFETCDYVVNLLPHTKETTGILTEAVLASGRVKGNVPVFVNCGRGTVVEEAVLVRALDAGDIKHAVLDVFPVEPLPQESPLWTHKSVTVTPHIAALTTAPDLAALFEKNLTHYLKGEQVEHLVDWEAGY